VVVVVVVAVVVDYQEFSPSGRSISLTSSQLLGDPGRHKIRHKD
jgi:hypothetical protein